jgi:hypothetical protein
LFMRARRCTTRLASDHSNGIESGAASGARHPKNGSRGLALIPTLTSTNRYLGCKQW